jgi:predicted DNA-binding antitoxin AbrB/MazE fold protein
MAEYGIKGKPMADYVRAIFEHGNFVPETPCDLPEGTKVLLAVHSRAAVSPPEVKGPEEQAAILRRVVERMHRNPLPEHARQFKRDEMHERG